MMAAGLMGAAVPFALANSEGIVAVVNEDPITRSDVEDRITLIIRSSGMPDNAEMRGRLRPQIMDDLIEEQLKLQEAKRLNIEVTQEMIDQGLGQLAQQNNATPEQFREMIGRSGININTMYRQIGAQMAWGQVIQKAIRPRITVTEADVEDGMARLRANLGKTEYRIAEVFLPVDDPADAGNIQMLATKLVQDMKAGKVPFFRVAQQFSKAAGAAEGGDLGWMQEDQLETAIRPVIAALEEKQISEPVKDAAGYHIYQLLAKRAITEDTMPSNEGMTSTIGTQRMERMQRRHFQDLKAQAFIENRV